MDRLGVRNYVHISMGFICSNGTLCIKDINIAININSNIERWKSMDRSLVMPSMISSIVVTAVILALTL
jgi:hypothetical protein